MPPKKKSAASKKGAKGMFYHKYMFL